MNELRAIIQHFLQRIRQTPLLLGWLLIGPFIALFLEGWMGLAFGLINIVLMVVYAVFIRWMTPNPALPIPVKRPKLEITFALLLLGLIIVIQLFDFDVWTIQPWYGWVKGLFARVYMSVESLHGIPDWARKDVYLAVSSTIKQLIPTLLVFWILRYQPADMGFARPHWKLTAALVGVTVAFGLVTGVLLRAPLIQVFGLYLIGVFINALPEEFFFRGLMLSRLEKFFANSLNALVISALLFNAIHIPINVFHGMSPLLALLGVFSIGYPSALIWGYLYLRTRSIVPGILWHATNGIFGFILMSL